MYVKVAGWGGGGGGGGSSTFCHLSGVVEKYLVRPWEGSSNLGD